MSTTQGRPRKRWRVVGSGPSLAFEHAHRALYRAEFVAEREGVAHIERRAGGAWNHVATVGRAADGSLVYEIGPPFRLGPYSDPHYREGEHV